MNTAAREHLEATGLEPGTGERPRLLCLAQDVKICRVCMDKWKEDIEIHFTKGLEICDAKFFTDEEDKFSVTLRKKK